MTANFQNPIDLRNMFFVFAFIVCALVASISNAQFEGFTEPIKTIELASDENGIVKSIHVSEGDFVTGGQLLVQLNDELQQVQLELAAHLAGAEANCNAAKQSYEKRQQVFENVAKLRERKITNENEVLRAELEMSIAFAKWKTAEDELVARKIEHERAKIVLENRKIKAPIDGVVSRLYREVGEYVSPINAEILTLIDDRQLHAVFNIPNADIRNLKVGQNISLEMENGTTVHGRVDSIGFVIDSESGTIVVKVLLDNADRSLRAGEACTLNI